MHRRLHERIAFFPVVLLSLLGAVACTPYATYPPMSDVEPLVPGLYPVPQVMGKSLKAAYDKTSGNLSEDGNAPALVYALPEGISPGNWKQISNLTGIEGARALTGDDYEAGVPFWSIEQVRIRNQRAEVDVVFPISDGFERATVILEAEPFRAYEVKFFQRWRVPVDKPAFTQPGRQSTTMEDNEAQEAGKEAEAVVAPEPETDSDES
ncbi:MAG: hypothetical protein CMJ34_02355 [Phycisphaerae bacterium]|nr:hypothetical protein [Phycisphaerae bacterium]